MRRSSKSFFEKHSFLALIFPLLLIALISAFFIVSTIVTMIDLEKSDLLRRLRTLDNTARLSLEIDIARAFEAATDLVSDESLILWLSGDPDPVYRKLALHALESLTQENRFDSGFAASRAASEAYLSGNVIERLSPYDPDDSWFYEALVMDTPVTLNVDHNGDLNQTMLWVNAQIRRGPDVIGIAGVGIDIEKLQVRLEALVPGENGQILFLDEKGKIHLAFPRGLIGRNLYDIREEGRRYIDLAEADDSSLRRGDMLFTASEIPRLGLTAMVVAPVRDFVSHTMARSIIFSLISVFFIAILALLILRVIYTLRRTILQQKKSHDMTILSMSMLAELKDHETGQHIVRTKKYCRILVDELRADTSYTDYLTDGYVEDLERSAPLHDIGKVGIPDSILLKPGKLTSEEFEVIKTHTALGSQVLQDAMDQIGAASFFSIGIQLVRHHHEKWDGSGYPDGLAGNDIPLSARIMAIADVYDALRTRRPYKEPFAHEAARNIILEGSGTHFQPELVRLFMLREKDFERVSIECGDEGAHGLETSRLF